MQEIVSSWQKIVIFRNFHFECLIYMSYLLNFVFEPYLQFCKKNNITLQVKQWWTNKTFFYFITEVLSEIRVFRSKCIKPYSGLYKGSCLFMHQWLYGSEIMLQVHIHSSFLMHSNGHCVYWMAKLAKS